MTATMMKIAPFGATVTFDDGSTMNFELWAATADRAAYWDYDGSRDTFNTLEDAIDDYVTYVTES